MASRGEHPGPEMPVGGKIRILVVDDEPRMGEALAVALRRSGHACRPCTSGEEALRLFDDHGADVVVTDWRMPGMDGLELLRQLHQRRQDLPVILITAYGDVRSAVSAMQEGAFDYVTKPFDHDELRALVTRAVELDRLRRENRELRRTVGAEVGAAMVAESPAMTTVLDLVDRAAPSGAAVLITGESGTGKELVARRIHALSPRLGKPFVAVNCKAFAEGVLESELFGHEKGAFTGAEGRREGCFQRADGGTLFLDEIGEVPPGFQAKLLRALQEGEVLPVGGDRVVRVDVRLVAATNRDLRAEIAAGRFREDLFYRLAVIPAHLPPLRERRADVVPLAEHFLARHQDLRHGGRATEAGGVAEPLTLSAGARSALERHPWPGNVRELENAIERAVVLARGRTLEETDLLLSGPEEGPSTVAVAGTGTLQEHLDQAAAEHIRAALDHHEGRRAEAARDLGIDRTTLFRWIKRLGLEG